MRIGDLTRPALALRGADAHTLLAVYLQDHLAGAAAGVALARRIVGNHRGTPLEVPLTQLTAEIDQDRRALLRLMAHLDIAASVVKSQLAAVGEWVGRGKLNGQVLGDSPLSGLVEFEGLRTGVEAKLTMWRALDVSLSSTRLPDGFDLAELIARAEAQRDELERYRQDSARAAFEALG